MSKAWFLSITIHVILVFTIFKSNLENHASIHQPKNTLLIQLVTKKSMPSKTGELKVDSKGSKIDLRPDFIKNATNDSGFLPHTKVDRIGEKLGIQNGISRQMLLSESKVDSAFDQLAQKIDVHLTYPDMLVEQGVQGLATLDLYFDEHGDIDEQKSRCRSGNRLLRGVLIKAVRLALPDWYQTYAKKLSKEEFRNQHYRAEFIISLISNNESRLDKIENVLGKYEFKRIKNIPACLSPNLDGSEIQINMACIVFQGVGILKRNLSDTYKSKYRALVDQLDAYDQMELSGINEIIKSGT